MTRRPRRTGILRRVTSSFLLAVAGACAGTKAPVEPSVRAAALPPQPAASVHLAWGPSPCNGRLLIRAFYAVCHTGDWRTPRWVVYHLAATDLPATVRRHDRYRADPDLPLGERAELRDYRKSGYSRGHMAPAGDFLRGAEAMDATFLLSNMAPQLQGLNAGRWRVLEHEVQTIAARHGRVWIVTGPLVLDAGLRPARAERLIGLERVAVPTHFFKVVLCEHPSGEFEMFAFILPHQVGLPGPTVRYAVSVDQVEALTQTDFFSELPDADETRLEAQVASIWPVH